MKKEYIEDYLAPEGGKVKNRIFFYSLDGEILRGIKTVGLQPQAVELFHGTIRKQLEMPYSEHDYYRYLQAMYEYTNEDLYNLGEKFRKK